MTKEQLVQKALEVALNRKTHYIWGGCGQSLNTAQKIHFVKDYDWGKKHSKEIMAQSGNTRAYDCVCFVKSLVFWGGPDQLKYDAKTDYTIQQLKDMCKASSDFSNVEIGEIVFRGTSHVGIVVDTFDNGGIMVVEANNSDESVYGLNGVYRSTFNCKIEGLPQRSWSQHGKIPSITY